MRLPEWFKRTARQRPIAHPIVFEGAGLYDMALDATWGVIFEDDGSTGYVYVTNATFDRIFDALHVYDCNTPGQLRPGEPVVLVWNPSRQRVGLHFRSAFQVAVALSERRACCRSAFPAFAPAEWGGTSHLWDERLTDGLG